MSDNSIQELLKLLKLHGMLNSFIEYEQAKSNKKISKEEWFLQLLQAELSHREARSINYQLATAKFPVNKSLHDYDFTQSQL